MGTTILMVEDQLEFSAIHKHYLERHGYHVLLAEDGETGVAMARQHQPRVILMDFSVPRLDGVSATARLKQDPQTRDIPVVLLTAHSYGSVGRRSREAGCDVFLSKPCEPRRVLQEVARLTAPH